MSPLSARAVPSVRVEVPGSRAGSPVHAPSWDRTKAPGSPSALSRGAFEDHFKLTFVFTADSVWPPQRERRGTLQHLVASRTKKPLPTLYFVGADHKQRHHRPAALLGIYQHFSFLKLISTHFLDHFNPVIVLFLKATHTSECSPGHSPPCTRSEGPRAKPGLAVLPVGVLDQQQSPGEI